MAFGLGKLASLVGAGKDAKRARALEQSSKLILGTERSEDATLATDESNEIPLIKVMSGQRREIIPRMVKIDEELSVYMNQVERMTAIAGQLSSKAGAARGQLNQFVRHGQPAPGVSAAQQAQAASEIQKSLQDAMFAARGLEKEAKLVSQREGVEEEVRQTLLRSLGLAEQLARMYVNEIRTLSTTKKKERSLLNNIGYARNMVRRELQETAAARR